MTFYQVLSIMMYPGYKIEKYVHFHYSWKCCFWYRINATLDSIILPPDDCTGFGQIVYKYDLSQMSSNNTIGVTLHFDAHRNPSLWHSPHSLLKFLQNLISHFLVIIL